MKTKVFLILCLVVLVLILAFVWGIRDHLTLYASYAVKGIAGAAALGSAFALRTLWHADRRRTYAARIARQDLIDHQAQAQREHERHEQEMAERRAQLDLTRQAHEARLDAQLRQAWLQEHLALTRIPYDPNGNVPILINQVDGQMLLTALPPGQNSRQIKAPRNQDLLAAAEQPQTAQQDASTLPTFVRYEDIRSQVPRGHALVGLDGRGLVTRDDAIRSMIWIVGGSGTGKTNTVMLRIEESSQRGHHLIIVDPHWSKPDSLWNAVRCERRYLERVLPIEGKPFVAQLVDIIKALDLFLSEFRRRKHGEIPVSDWDGMTLVVDEVGSLAFSDEDDLDEDEEDLRAGDSKTLIESLKRKLKKAARICGQESRNYNMGGIYISQDVAGLAWLRKRALMVLVHQLTMMSERKIACNDNMEIARSMDSWPRGRTLVYGIGFTEGQQVLQQPVFDPAKIVDADPSPDAPQKTISLPPLPDLPVNPLLRNTAQGNKQTLPVSPGKPAPVVDAENVIKGLFPVSPADDRLSTKKIDSGVYGETKKVIWRLHRKGMPLREIAMIVGLAGKKYDQFKQVCTELGIDPNDKKVGGEA